MSSHPSKVSARTSQTSSSTSKPLAVRMHAEGPKKMRLNAEGPCEVTTAQIEAGADIEIMNPDLVICTLG